MEQWAFIGKIVCKEVKSTITLYIILNVDHAKCKIKYKGLLTWKKTIDSMSAWVYCLTNGYGICV